MPATIRPIQKLPPVLIDRIAAGEVVEGPFSVIKELAENCIDAGATEIHVETEGGGIDLIRVRDNGRGIPYEELPASVERHATSKIDTLEDLDSIDSFGFRGEALASIASVSHLEIRSCTTDSAGGGLLESRGGRIERVEPIPANEGTTIVVRELFYATPARRKFLKTERTENARNWRAVLNLALAHPGVRFVYSRDGREYANLSPTDDLKARAGEAFVSKLKDNLIQVDYDNAGIRLHGLVSQGDYHRSNRDGQFLFVNNRCVELKHFSYLVKKAYGEILPPGAHPYYFLFLDLDPARVDVNVHPQKREVRLLDQNSLYSIVNAALEPLLQSREPLMYDLNRRVNPDRFAHTLEKEPSIFERPPEVRTTHSIAPVEEANDSGVAEDGGLTVAPNEEGADCVPLAREFIPLRHFGVIFGTYILAEGDDAFYIIDQHTAHERINYEKKRRELEARHGERQPLLHPIVVDATRDEIAQLESCSGCLVESGFVVEVIGESQYVVREVPVFVEPGTEEEVVGHLVQRVIEGEESVRLYDEYAAMKACKASIKKNDYVPGSVLSEIVTQLAQCENPARCPHGRPTMYRISRSDLDRIFHR